MICDRTERCWGHVHQRCVSHGHELGAVSEGAVDERIHPAVRDRGEVPPGTVPSTLAEGISLSDLFESGSIDVPQRPADLLPVSPLRASNDAAERDAFSIEQAAVDDLVPGYSPADIDQNQHGGAGIEAALGRVLPHGVAT